MAGTREAQRRVELRDRWLNPPEWVDEVDRSLFSKLVAEEAFIDPEREAAVVEILADGGRAAPHGRRPKDRRRSGDRRGGE